MSITIVSTPSRPAEVSATDKTLRAGNDTPGDYATTPDFASLLLGQLQPLRPVVLDSVQKTAEPTDMTFAEATPSDATSLLAALGLIQQGPARKTDLQEAENAAILDKSKDENIATDVATPTPIAAQVTALVTQRIEPVDNTQNTGANEPHLLGIGKLDKGALEPASAPARTFAAASAGIGLDSSVVTESVTVPAGTPTMNDQPAKLAAATVTAPTEEITSSKIVTSDAEPSTTPILASNTHGNPPTPVTRHEVSLSVPTPVRDQGWANDLGQKIVWLASNDKQSAQITLNPPQIGPIEISLSLDKGNASASFTSANSEVRNALETAMPRLREMFASAGIELGQTNVSAESFRQQADNGAANRGSSQWRTDNAILVTDSAISQSSRVFSAQHGSGLVDLFA